ncbi:MAG: hypothetical protein RL722_1655 [Pseudomonadota bacterium]|jgi:3-methyladenine DNA glycosylase AlkC
MATALKDRFGADVPARIADMLQAVHPAFDRAGFITESLAGYDALELTPRAWQIAHALRRHLPADTKAALDLLVRSLGPKLVDTSDDPGTGQGMGVFVYLPHVFLVAQYGLDHVEASLRAQHELTQRFTAEFSIRPFLERHPQATLARLAEWTRDPSPHVRRLVSEGTRPRLPWAPRLRDFQRDPTPVLALLECLKDDGNLYVRRSVANNLNDIGKDHPALLAEVATRWLTPDAQGHPVSAERRWLVTHALRSAVKRGEPAALAALGFGGKAKLTVAAVQISPARPRIGEAVQISLSLANDTKRAQTVCVDLAVHFIKASGEARPKVFKLRNVDLAPGESQAIAKTIALHEMTTRKHYPGLHRVDLVLNGEAQEIGAFDLRSVG